MPSSQKPHIARQGKRADHDSSDTDSQSAASEPVYARKTPSKSYHGPHFEKGPEQERLWDDRSRKLGQQEVWDPSKPLRHIQTRPETVGRAHSMHPPLIEHKMSKPYEKRPQPYTNRVQADYDSYKRAENACDRLTPQVAQYKDNPKVGRNHIPTDADRDALRYGRQLATEAVSAANGVVQSRAGFLQKYPQGYEEHGLSTHKRQVTNAREAADNARDSVKYMDERLEKWQVQRDRRDGRERRRDKG